MRGIVYVRKRCDVMQRVIAQKTLSHSDEHYLVWVTRIPRYFGAL